MAVLSHFIKIKYYVMNNYIKHIVEAFDFNNINNQKKSVNVYDVLL